MCTHFQKICSCSRHEHSKTNTKISISLVKLLHFCFSIIASKMLIFEICLLLKKPLVTTLNEHVHSLPEIMTLKKGLNVPKSSKNTNYFGPTPPFCFRILSSKMLIFEICLPLKEPLVVTFGETCAHTSRKYVVVQGMNLLRSSKKYKLLWLHSSIFALE